jgi:ABC-type Fe3+ transport system permease subunit
MLKKMLIRWAAALILVFITYNPTSLNYVRWAIDSYATNLSVVILLGLILFVAYAVFVRATLQSTGKVGIGMIVAVIGVLLWVLYDKGLLDPANSTLMTWIGLVALSLILGIGLSWSIIRRRISGQVDTRHSDDDHEVDV